jgi:hypothetical protein
MGSIFPISKILGMAIKSVKVGRDGSTIQTSNANGNCEASGFGWCTTIREDESI